MQISKPAVAWLMFFLLDQKEPKNQECRIASGRHSALRAWVATLQMALLGSYASRCHAELVSGFLVKSSGLSCGMLKQVLHDKTGNTFLQPSFLHLTKPQQR